MFEGYITAKFANKYFEKDVFKIIKRHTFWGTLLMMIPDFGFGGVIFAFVLWHMYSSICEKVGISFSDNFWKLAGTGFIINIIVALILDVLFSFFFFLVPFITPFQFYLSGKFFVETLKHFDSYKGSDTANYTNTTTDAIESMPSEFSDTPKEPVVANSTTGMSNDSSINLQKVSEPTTEQKNSDENTTKTVLIVVFGLLAAILIIAFVSSMKSCKDSPEDNYLSSYQDTTNYSNTYENTASYYSEPNSYNYDEEVEEVAEDEETSEGYTDDAVISFIETFYQRFVFEDADDIAPFASYYFSDELKSELRRIYDETYIDGEGYAMWLFRTDFQDGDGESYIKDIQIYEGDVAYVTYSDMGNDGACAISFDRQTLQFLGIRPDARHNIK